MRLLPLLLLVLVAASCASTSRQKDNPPIADGRDLVRAMHAKYDGKWYDRLIVTQGMVFYRDGEPAREETWTEYIELPGKVRSIAGDEADGNGEIYVDGAFHIIRDGLVVQSAPRPHPVLHIGYDVYCQPPEATIAALENAKFDLSIMHETTWNDRSVYVAGAKPGDEKANQFWIDVERLLCQRIITTSPTGAAYDIRFTKYEEFAGSWLCTGLVFYRDGVMLIAERDLGHSIPDVIDPARFVPPRRAGS